MSRDARFVIVVSSAPLPPSINHDVWPHHVTVAPVFVADEPAGRRVLPELIELAGLKVPPFEVVLGPPESFGPNRSMRVLLTDHAALTKLHRDLASALQDVEGFAAETVAHWGPGYRSHVSISLTSPAETGDRLEIGVISAYTSTGSSWELVGAAMLTAK